MIRAATIADEPELLAMGRAFNEEAGYAETVPFNEDSFKVTLAILGTAGLLLVADVNGKAVAMAAADVAPSICNHGVRIGQECFWYVAPSHRNGKIGKKLLAALECAAQSQGATFFDVVAEDGERSEPLARLYRAGSYNPRSRTFRKRLPGV